MKSVFQRLTIAIRRMLACNLSPRVSTRVTYMTGNHVAHVLRPLVLGMIRMIKLFGWEHRVANEVAQKREEELRFVRRVRMRQFLMNYVK